METLLSMFHGLQILLPGPFMHPEYLFGTWLDNYGTWKGMEAALMGTIYLSIGLPLISNFAVPFVNPISSMTTGVTFERLRMINPVGWILFWHIFYFMIVFNSVIINFIKNGVPVSFYHVCLLHPVPSESPSNYKHTVRIGRILWLVVIFVPAYNVIHNLVTGW